MVEFSQKIHSLPRVIFDKKLLQNNLLEASHSATRSVPYISRRHRRPRIYKNVYIIVIFHTFHSDPLHMIKQNKLLLFHMESGECYV